MASRITTYQCPACTGPLHYVGASGKLECDFCGSKYDVAEIEALYAQKETENACEKENEKQESHGEPAREQSAQPEGEWDQSEFTEDWGNAAMQTYSCPSCGAELICDRNTAATSCPYCGNPAVIPGKFSGALKPELIVPFKVTREEAKAALKKHYRGKHLLPKMFTAENRIDEIKGIYVPFWMFDSQADADVTAEAEQIAVHREGDYQVTNVSHFHVRRRGTVEFKNIPVDASSKMPDDYMDALEPFDYSALCPFSTAYLPGFFADQYDVNTQECSARAEKRMKESAISVMKADMAGYDTCTPIKTDVQLRKGKVHYAMLPVYLLNTRWHGKQFLFAMNGQTGKMVSNLPVSWGKFWGILAGIAVPLTALAGTIIYWVM